jgi:hypothetical protein
MKKFFAIAIASLVLLSGMHFTVATHYCGGKIAATRVSVLGKMASCGMVHDEKSGTSPKCSFSSNCCENKISVYSTDNNYTPSAFHFKVITQYSLHDYYLPRGFSFYTDFSSLGKLTAISPPDKFLANTVSISEICVFRI